MSGITIKSKKKQRIIPVPKENDFLHYCHLGQICHELLHEIKNKLIAPSTFLQTFSKNYKNEKFRNEFSVLAASELECILKQINQLLSYSKKEMRTEADSAVQRPFDRIIHDCLVLLDWELKKNDIVVETDVFSAMVFPIKNSQLKDIVVNLILNAIHAMKSKKEGKRILRIGTFQNENQSGFLIEDTGIGMTEKALLQIFDPFYTTKKSGTGVGLSIVKKYLEENEGLIKVSSQKNKGSCFKIYFEKRD
jgi:polar amino acid transport system substrate-binding protein